MGTGTKIISYTHLKNLWNFENLLKYFAVALADLGTKKNISFNHIYKNHFKKGKYGKT